ncbi:MAG: molybdate ABC transporter permease subunit [Vicinamibacteria bacterium]|nr:molybdate ABC transporter permease subunit [Vicinamibacteria bacterium]MBP9946494.1 molybdate ABC transporter permease subunit [Vicinamibacteria bacterium]
MDFEALRVSLALAAATSASLFVIGLPLGYWLAFTRSRARLIVEPIVALPLVLPPTVLGLCVLLALGPRSPFGRTLEEMTGRTFAFTFEGLLVASILYSLPFAVQPFATAFASVDTRLREAAFCLGASRASTFFRVILPLSKRGVIAGLILSFAHTLGEFGVVLMVGGNIPGVTRTASIAIYDSVQALDYAAALRTSAVLVTLSLAILAATSHLLGGLVLPGARRR